jgi:hypothetical protein
MGQFLLLSEKEEGMSQEINNDLGLFDFENHKLPKIVQALVLMLEDIKNSSNVEYVQYKGDIEIYLKFMITDSLPTGEEFLGACRARNRLQVAGILEDMTEETHQKAYPLKEKQKETRGIFKKILF